MRTRWIGRAAALAALLGLADVLAVAQQGGHGLRDPAWSPDGKRLAVSWFDRLWTLAPDGRQARPILRAPLAGAERDPAWSPDGTRLAFAADRGSGFDLYVVAAKGGAAERVTTLAGDERWPSWTPGGRLVFAHRDREGASTDSGLAQWHLDFVAEANGVWQAPVRLTTSRFNEMQPRVSPDGSRLAFVSDRDSDDRDFDLWIMPLPMEVPRATSDADTAAGTLASARAASEIADRLARLPFGAVGRPVRLRRTGGNASYPAWAPAGDRVAYLAVREGLGSVWVAPVDAPLGYPPAPGSPGAGSAPTRPAPAPVLVSRHGGSPAWSPDGKTILIGELPEPEPDYNGNPQRVSGEPPPTFDFGRAFHLWSVPAPEPVDAAGRDLAVDMRADPERFTRAFDEVWQTLKHLYYSTGAAAAEWETLGTQFRPEAERAGDDDAFETVVDRLIAAQPLIKPAVTSARAVVVSGHPLASEAGRQVLEMGGNVVDALIATAFALGVVEPDASGIGGDGQAILFLKGMAEPTVVEYKDQTPIHATADNPRLLKDGRIIADGPAAPNIPGVVAGLEYLYRHYGSGKVSWDALLAPAIKYADEGYVLDETLPTTIAEGRPYLEKYPEARRIFLPNGDVPRPGDRFVNRDYAATLGLIARGGADAFYRGELARRIAEDLQANGGIIGLEDLAQYRAIERRPLVGRYRDHLVYGPPPPVTDGAQIIEMLQILGNYTPRPGARFTTDPDYFHYLIESWKARDLVRRVEDSDHAAADLAIHLAPAHAARLFERIDAQRAMRIDRELEDDEAATGGRIRRGTTAMVVADADGNMIASTHTLSTWGGNFYVSKGLGFLYNNHLRLSGSASGGAPLLLPLSRSGSSSAPTLVFADVGGTPVPRLAVSAAGNAWITASIYSLIANVVDGGMSMQRAIEAPRFLIGRDPADAAGTGARIQIEDRIPRATLDNLTARGHVFQRIGRKGEVRYGYAAAALVDVKNHQVEGGAEPRRSHAAVGLP